MPLNNIFALTLPEGWQETTVHTFQGPDDSGLKHNLVLSITPFIGEEEDIKTYVRSQIETSLSGLSGFELLAEKEIHLPDGSPGYEIAYKYVPADEVILFQKQLYVLSQKKLCIFTSTFKKKTLQTIGVEVQDIIKSFRMFDPRTIQDLLDEE